jgi:hypothetical protein
MRCAGHKKADDVDVVHKKCFAPNCAKVPTFGPEGGKAIHCVAHKQADEIDVLNRNKRCSMLGCKKQPSFGPEGGKAIHCAAHKGADEVDVINKRCLAPGCRKQPSFGVEGGSAVHCVEHKRADEVDVINKRCLAPGCRKQPSFGPEGGKAIHCAAHKGADEVDVINKRCLAPGCRKRPSFGVEGGLAVHCAEHKQAGEVNVVSRLCALSGCHKFPSFGPKGGPATYCAAHKSESDVDVYHERCPVCGLFITNGKICAICNPDAYKKTKEGTVVTYLRAQTGLECFVHNKTVDVSCDRSRPDIRYDCGTHVVIVEIDENQHKARAYDECELPRMANLVAAIGMPTRFIRFNPDSFMSFTGNRLTIPLEHRLSTLASEIRRAVRNQPTEFVNVTYLYYNAGHDGPKTADVLHAIESGTSQPVVEPQQAGGVTDAELTELLDFDAPLDPQPTGAVTDVELAELLEYVANNGNDQEK